jgi:UDP-2-acetamido-2,6-beta-L-arabino-hexul-4-ose reductase
MLETPKSVLVTGSKGFIGRNLVKRLEDQTDFKVTGFNRQDDPKIIPKLISEVDVVVHLAGENRPANNADFVTSNVELTRLICEAAGSEPQSNSRKLKIIFSSSTHSQERTPYGRSKKVAEKLLVNLSSSKFVPISILRLPGVFGKWCKPNYNSVVATFCHNIARGLPIKISDPDKMLTLTHIDTVVDCILNEIIDDDGGLQFPKIEPVYNISVGQLSKKISSFEKSRKSLVLGRVGSSLERSLYSTYISYLPPSRFSYKLPMFTDKRGTFVEMLKTQDSGQFSVFTAYPGVTRGEHYHHSKTEKFLVVKGEALFRFRCLQTQELVEIQTSAKISEVVDSVPGWVHDVTNTGDEEMVVLVWANEIFDQKNPDTNALKVLQ